jgi:CheY-like chemotaxis protein
MKGAGMDLARAIKVLVVEDVDRDFEKVIAALATLPMEVAVQRASDYDSARDLLVTEHFDLVLLDLVLSPASATDVDSWEGLWLLWDIAELELRNDRRVIILTQYQREHPEVTRLAFVRFAVRDFLSKELSISEIANELAAFIEDEKYFGLACTVAFEPPYSSWEDLLDTVLTGQLRSLGARLSHDHALEELESLFRQLNRQCTSASLGPLGVGYSGTSVVRAKRYFGAEHGSDAVIKYGAVDLISKERAGWLAVAEYLSGTRSTRVEEYVRGLGLGGIRYGLLGAGSEILASFGEFYVSAETSQVCKAVGALFEETCGRWYEPSNRRPEAELNLQSAYETGLGINLDRIIEGYEFRFGRRLSRASDIVNYPEVGSALPNVVGALRNGSLAVSAPSWLCRTHGDMHGDNVLVSGDGSGAWIIDFGNTGFGHWSRDFVVLEAFIRFKLATGELSDLFQLETALAGVERLDQPADLSGIADAAIRKAGSVISHLRGVAGRVIAPYPSDRALAEYTTALMFAMLKYFQLQRLLDRKWRKHHVLVAACIQLQQLNDRYIPLGLLQAKRSGSD